MAEAEWQRIREHVREGSARAGFDLVHAFAVAAYNAAVPEEWRLAAFERPAPLGVLIGNTRALWAAFLETLAAEPELAASEHPLDDYLQARVVPLLESAGAPYRLYWAHEVTPRALPIQRLAEISGLASLAPSHLSIHPLYGPWFALRAVAVFDVDGPEAPARLESPCPSCEQPCVPALERALELTGAELGRAGVAKHAAAWIAVRDACPVGREARYSSDQIGYHYTKDRSLLRR
jgi:cyanocobalamin reductase (cyanide-eliminating) / alkylcobalamin dealkylase